MTKTFKKNNNSSLRKKKISVRNKSKKNRKSISKIQRIVKRKQTGGVVNWEQVRTASELNLNEFLAEYLIPENKIKYLNLYVINNEDLRQLSVSIKQNQNLRSIVLKNAILKEPHATPYDPLHIISLKGNEKNEKKELTKQILEILFGFTSSKRDLKINLSSNGEGLMSEWGFLFDTNILYDFFTRNKECKIISLDLTGWKFTIAGLYNLALLELLGKVERDSIKFSETFYIDTVFHVMGEVQYGIDYNIIKNKMKEGLQKIRMTTVSSLNKVMNVHPDPTMSGFVFSKEIIAKFTKTELRTEEDITNEEILACCLHNISVKNVIIIRLFLKNYGETLEKTFKKESERPNSPIYLSWRIILALMDENEEDVLRQISVYMGEMVSIKGRDLLRAYATPSEIKDIIIEVFNNCSMEKNPLTYLDYFNKLMRDRNIDSLRVLFPSITPEDITNYSSASS
jgi:hypothetical protein